MSHMKKKIKIKDKVASMDGEVMFPRLLAVNCKIKVPLTRVFSFENSPVPMSLFTERLMRSCAKSDFMHKLKDLIPRNEGDTARNESSDANIFDGHAKIQILAPSSMIPREKFQDMAQKFFSYIKMKAASMNLVAQGQIHVSFDRYKEFSVKSQTRQKRGESSSPTYEIKADLQNQNWKLFLSDGENKAGLARYYTEYICENLVL